MTTPTLARRPLGDFSQIQLGPNLPVPIMNGEPGQNVTIANQDLTNTITIARRNNFTQNGPNTATIPPLGSITVDASRTIWGLAPPNTLPPLIFPGGGNWAPSPAQVAAQIQALGLATASNQVTQTGAINNPAYGPSTLAQQVTQQTAIPNNIATTGVPLLSLPNQLNSSGFTVNAGTTTTLGPFTFNQPGYEFLAGFWSAGTTNTFARIVVQWNDPTSGAIVDQQIWWLIPGTDATTNLHNISGTGPTENTSVSFLITAFTNNVNVVNCIIHTNSRIYSRHNFYSIKVANLALSGTPGITPHDVSGYVLCNINVGSVATNTHITQYIPLYCGKVQIWVHTSSNTSDATLTLAAFSDNATGLVSPVNYLQTKSDGAGNINMQAFTPRAQLQVLVNNGNAATQSITLSMVMTDY